MQTPVNLSLLGIDPRNLIQELLTLGLQLCALGHEALNLGAALSGRGRFCGCCHGCCGEGRGFPRPVRHLNAVGVTQVTVAASAVNSSATITEIAFSQLICS